MNTVNRRGRGLLLALAGLAGGPSLGAQTVTDLPGSDRPLEYTLQELYRVGTMDGAEWEMFSNVTQVAFDRDGNLYIWDSGSRLSLVQLGPDGRFLRQFIRQGDGPGEVTRGTSFGVQRDGQVMVVDMGRRALSWFGQDGGFVGSSPFDPVAHGLPSAPLFPHPEGGFVSLQTGMVMMGGPGGMPAPPTTYPVNRVTREGEFRRLFDAWRPPREATAGTAVQMGGGGAIRLAGGMGPRVFDPNPTMGMLPDGRLLIADSTTWAVKVVGDGGRVERVLRRPIRPRAVTREDQEAERNRRRADIEEGRGPQISMTATGPSGPVNIDQNQIRQGLLRQLDDLEFAEEMPVLARVRSDWEGRLWAERRGPRVGERGPLDVVSASGTYMGTIGAGGLPLPDAFGPGGLVAFIERDELDIPRVAVKRLRLNPR